ncbi:hypothetical protein ACXJJ3_12850 [Kribbella sp. WER1]
MATRMVCGYLKRPFMADAREIAAARKKITDYAVANQLDLAMIFEDDDYLERAQLQECFYLLLHVDERAMIIPDLSHLDGLGGPPQAALRAFENEGVKILVARPIEPSEHARETSKES